MTDSVIVEYEGPRVFVSAFVQALTDEGLQVRYDRSAPVVEQRGVPDPSAVAHAYVSIEAWFAGHPIEAGAATLAVERAIERWRAGRLAKAAEVRLQGGPRHRA